MQFASALWRTGFTTQNDAHSLSNVMLCVCKRFFSNRVNAEFTLRSECFQTRCSVLVLLFVSQCQAGRARIA